MPLRITGYKALKNISIFDFAKILTDTKFARNFTSENSSNVQKKEEEKIQVVSCFRNPKAMEVAKIVRLQLFG